VNGKHGTTQLTPLQMACGHSEPDVETIRSFLDKGRLCVVLCFDFWVPLLLKTLFSAGAQYSILL